MTAIEDARDAAENCWPMDMDGLPGNQSRKERELLRRGFELGYRAAVERLTTPPTADEREDLGRIVADFLCPAGYEITESDYLLADRILASDVWRNRRQGPYMDEWEYEVTYSGRRNPTSDGFRFRSSSGILSTLGAAREWAEKVPNPVIRRRTKGVEAGPWVPVEAARDAS